MKTKRLLIGINILLFLLLCGILLCRIFSSPSPKELVFSKAETTYFYLVNINTADALHLQMLPGIGETISGAIVDYRIKNGPFTSLAELDKVHGIGPSVLAKIKPFIKFFD